MANRRLVLEIKDMNGDKTNRNEILLEPNPIDIFEWRAVIKGPQETPYERRYFKLKINVPKDYPFQPPKVIFLTKIFHPNIHFKTGEICLDLLKNSWSAIYTLQSICRAIIDLLAYPEADSPLNCDCGNILRSGDIRGYNSMARMYSKLYGEDRLSLS